jgi:hypothetical protein
MNIKQQMIESLERSIEKATARIKELSEPCVKSLAHSRSAERDFLEEEAEKVSRTVEGVEK